MKHTIEFVKGKMYWIDESVYGKKHKVTLKHFWEKTMLFALVKNEKGSEWETMLCRLTEISEDDKDIDIPKETVKSSLLEVFKKQQ